MASAAGTPRNMSLVARPGNPTSSSVLTATKEGMVIVEIGQTQKKYFLHRAILPHHSEYLQKALSGPWKDVTLNDVETSTFNLFVHWLYTQKIPYDLFEDDWKQILELGDDEKATTQARLTTCIKAYALGDRLIAPVFLQHVNDRFTQFYSKHKGYLPAERYPLIEFAFNNNPLNRVVLQFLVDHHCTHYCWEPTGGEEDQVDMFVIEDCLPRRFLLRTIKRKEELDTNGEKCNCRAKHMRYDARVDFGFFD